MACGPKILGVLVWEALLQNCRVQEGFLDLLTLCFCDWVAELGLEQAFEEAARPLSHPETIAVPNHGNLWSLHGLGYPGHSPTHPGFPQITTATHSHGPRGHSVPDCLPWACLLQLACPQEPEGQHPRAVSQPPTP